MSWSVNALGKPAAVAAKLAEDFTRISLMREPEETGRQAAAKAIAAIVPAYPDNFVVRVECSGGQYTPDSSKAPDKHVNSLTIKIETLGPIVE